MDVNLALSRLRDAVRTVNREQDGTDEPFTQEQAVNVLRNMSDHFEALDAWLTRGGFLPSAWERPE